MVQRSRFTAVPCFLVLLAFAEVEASPQRHPDLLDPKVPSFSSRSELDEVIVPVANAVRGTHSNFARKARKLGKSAKAFPCTIAKARKGAKSDAPRRLENGQVSVCLDFAKGLLTLTSRKAGSDSVVSWIPVVVSEAAVSRIEQARLVGLGGATLLELELRETNDPSEGGILDDRSLVLIDPVRELYLANVNRSHTAEGGSAERGNFTETCEGVAQIRGGKVILGGYACEEESIEESESGEVRTYRRSTGPDPEFSYIYRDGFLVQDGFEP